MHLGDKGPLTEENLKEIGRIDVLMLPVDGLEHILKTVEVAAIRDALNPAVTIPITIGSTVSWPFRARSARSVPGRKSNRVWNDCSPTRRA